jgi:hypothetical protein
MLIPDPKTPHRSAPARTGRGGARRGGATCSRNRAARASRGSASTMPASRASRPSAPPASVLARRRGTSRGVARRRHRAARAGAPRRFAGLDARQARRRGGGPLAGEAVASGGMIDAPPASRRGPSCAESGLTMGLVGGRFTLSNRPCRSAAVASPVGQNRPWHAMDLITQSS